MQEKFRCRVPSHLVTHKEHILRGLRLLTLDMDLPNLPQEQKKDEKSHFLRVSLPKKDFENLKLLEEKFDVSRTHLIHCSLFKAKFFNVIDHALDHIDVPIPENVPSLDHFHDS